MEKASKLSDYRIIGVIFIIIALAATSVFAVGGDKVIAQGHAVKQHVSDLVAEYNIFASKDDSILLDQNDTTDEVQRTEGAQEDA